MTPFTKCALIILLTLTMFNLAQSYKLFIVNELGENMIVQCRSKDKDIGREEISNGYAYSWNFELFYEDSWDCTIQWSQATRQFEAFYPGLEDNEWCTPTYCQYIARRKGIYMDVLGTTIIGGTISNPKDTLESSDTIRKKEETHRIAEANKVFTHFR
ncbi:Plant self-incompatibility S1 [Dillenia turbinata]|uniref:S-protein homolog n=1 Tax=Dillenia turbinata TaxID=194707 RepID=A0AAN8VUL1_9MAGN